MTEANSASSPPTVISFAGHKIELSPDGLIWIPALKLLCAADLHFEKGSFFSRFATLLPPYDSLENLVRLQRVLNFYQPDIFIAVGDSFHDQAAGLRMRPEHRLALNALIAQVPHWHWLKGNHDPDVADSINGQRGEELQHGGLTFRHQTLGIGVDAEISGHFHPKLRLKVRRQTITGACFVQQGSRLILPAFGQYTGGLDVHSAAFKAVMPMADRTHYLLHNGSVYAV